MWAYGIWGCGVRPGDTAYIAFGYGSFIGFWGLHYAMEKIGVLNVPGGAQTHRGARAPDRRLRRHRRRLHPHLRAAPGPGGPARWASTCAARRCSRLILSGEPAGSIPQTKALIEEQWGAKAYDTAGMTEIGTIMVFECAHQPGGTHIIEDHVIEEVIDPDDAGARRLRERGERVVTSFGRGADPAAALPHRRPRLQGAGLHVRLRARL